MSKMIQLIQADCLDWMRKQPDDSVDLVFTSPPYADARTYGMGFKARGEDWVQWAMARYLECVRISRGLVCWIVEGRTKDYRWTAEPVLLMADLHRAGVNLRKPPVYHRVGVPGSGGPDYWRNDWEFCICATSGGRLPWSDNTAAGKPPKYGPGGRHSNRMTNGERANERKMRELVDGGMKQRAAARAVGVPFRTTTSGVDEGGLSTVKTYIPPKIANPGNVIKCSVGGGRMGSRLCHENEAPFPEALVEPFILSFCPPNGITLDIFSGSGTTVAVAARLGRRGIGIDIRESQIELAKRRTAEIQREIVA